MRLALILAAMLVATPASAQVVAADGVPARVQPGGETKVQLLVGPHGVLGKDAPGAAVSRLIVAPGAAIPEHVHDGSDEIVVMQSGQGVFTLDGVERPVKVGDVVFIPKGHKHAFRAEGKLSTRALQIYDPSGPEARFLAWPTPFPSP